MGKREAEFEVLCCFDESVYYKKRKEKEVLDDLNLLDKLCMVQYEGYKR